MEDLLDWWQERYPEECEWTEHMRGEWNAHRIVHETLKQRLRNSKVQRLDLERHAERLIERNKMIDERLKKLRKKQEQEEKLRIEAEKTVESLRAINKQQNERIAMMYGEATKLVQVCEVYKTMFRQLRDGISQFYLDECDNLTLQQKTAISQLTTESPFDRQSRRRVQ